MAVVEDLVRRATADPVVVGLVLTGSQARGVATRHSDVDVHVVVADRCDRWSRIRSALLDQVVCTVDALADTSDVWQRYAFRGATVLLDRLDGGIAELVERQAVPTEAEARMWGREGLDGYLNLAYRAAKGRRDGADLAAALDEQECVPWLLTTVFALHGRLRPYNKYLRWELETYPLDEPWTASSFPTRALHDPIGLFPEVEGLARHCGHGDVLDAWGTDLTLLRTTRRPA